MALRLKLLFALAVTLCTGATGISQDAADIVRRSVAREIAGSDVPADYTYQFRETRTSIGHDGSRKPEESKTYEVMVLYGRRIQRLVALNDKPLEPDQDRKEKSKFEASFREIAAKSPEERARSEENERRKTARERDFLRAIPDAYDLRIVGGETVDGRDTWVIEAAPRKTVKTNVSGPKANLLRLYGKLWIDKTDYQWVRVEAEARETLAYGLFIARIYPGSRIVFENRRLNDDLWVPSLATGRFMARFLGVKRFALEDETRFFNYQKFRVSTRLLAASEAGANANSGENRNEHPQP